MNHHNTINIDKSSFISLQAELIRKKEELRAQSANASRKLTKLDLKNDIKEPKKAAPLKSNKEAKDDDIEASVLEHSKKTLLAKSELYEKLRNKELVTDDSEKFLVNFDINSRTQRIEEPEEVEEAEKAYESDPNSDPENDWVEYVDTLGRSRKCLRKDLHHYKKLNENLVDKQKPPDEEPHPEPAADVSEEMRIWYQKREELRKKWEDEEKALSHKRDIHYEDVLFDEARTHGVGYYKFSHDETERLQQQEALKKMREETEKNQRHVMSVKERRERQMKQRLEAAKRRKRERLGLPPDAVLDEELPPEPLNDEEEKKKLEEEEKMNKKIEEYLAQVKRSAHVRPWDSGKAGLQPPIMSQDQWVNKQRSKRDKEFAPPSSYKVENIPESEKSGLFFTSKRPKKEKPEKIRFEESADEEKPCSPAKQGAAIPPPTSYEKPTIKPRKQNLMESIEAGLNYLRNEEERKSTKKRACFKN